MECLVIKLPGSATDDTLRKLDEFRFKAKKAGNGSGYSRITFVVKGNTASSIPKLKIVSGEGVLSLSQGGETFQEIELVNNGNSALVFTIFLKVSSDCVLGLDNSKSIEQVGSYSPITYFFNRGNTTDSPILSLNISELRVFKHCTNIYLVSGQEANVTGDISVFKGFSASRIEITGASTHVLDVTGDISSFDKLYVELKFNYTNLYGTIHENLARLYTFACRSCNIEGDMNILGENLTSFQHSTVGYNKASKFTFDFSANTPKPNTVFLYDAIGGAFSGEFSDLIVPSRTSGLNIYCVSVGSPVNTDIYELLRRASNKQITSINGTFGNGSTYTFSGTLVDFSNYSGIGILNITSNNIPDENAIEILDYINRSSVNTSLDKNISLRCNSSNSQISTLVSQLQAKGYTVNIYPLI